MVDKLKSKKGMEVSGLTIVMAAVILIAIALLAFYWMSSSGKSVKALTGCGINLCATDASKCGKSNQILSMTSCTTKNNESGFCCTDSPV